MNSFVFNLLSQISLIFSGPSIQIKRRSSLKIDVIKDRWLAQRPGGDMCSVVLKVGAGKHELFLSVEMFNSGANSVLGFNFREILAFVLSRSKRRLDLNCFSLKGFFKENFHREV